MKRIILNSGGFDSTTLLVNEAKQNKDEIYSLYFSYGQLNDNLGKKCAETNAKKVGAKHYNVELPEISWTKGEFYNPDKNEYKSQYLEMRNMIFISYAMSLAESIGADVIEMALLKGFSYTDTSSAFIEKVKSLCEIINVDFVTPYSELDKEELFKSARILGVGEEYDFISCDTPKNGVPCKDCADCEEIQDYNDFVSKYSSCSPDTEFYLGNFNPENPKFQQKILNEEMVEARIVLNNDCQYNCSHCYHKNNPLIDETLTDSQLCTALKSIYDYGIREFHFAGKEPLYNDRIFKIIEYLKTLPDVNYHVVTNGINVPKYRKELKHSGISKVFLSADDEYGTKHLRKSSTNNMLTRAVECLNELEIPIEIFYDLTPDSIEHTVDNLEMWHGLYGINDFYIRTVRNLSPGNSIVLSNESLEKLHNQLLSVDFGSIELNIGACPYTYNILHETNGKLRESILYTLEEDNNWITNNYFLFAEVFCGKYLNTITLTADGYVLGCPMECSVKNYDKISSGNIKTDSLEDIIKKGKEYCLHSNYKQALSSKPFKECFLKNF